MADLSYQPVVRDRQAEHVRAAQLPGYVEARQEAADEFRNLPKYG